MYYNSVHDQTVLLVHTFTIHVNTIDVHIHTIDVLCIVTARCSTVDNMYM